MIGRQGVLLVAGVGYVVLGCGVREEPSTAHVAILSAAAYDSLPTLTLVDAGRLCAEGEDRCLTTGDQLAAVRSDGAVVFLGPGDRSPQLYLVAAASRVPLALGRAGSGPGEYRLVMSVAFTEDGSIRAYDGAQRRLLQFSADGGPQRTETAPLPDAPFDGGFVRGELRFLATDVPPTRGDSMPVRIYAIDGGTARARVHHDLPFRHPGVAMSDFREMPQPFEPVAQFAFAPDGALLRSTGARFEVDRYDADGAHDARFGFDREPRAVTAEELADARARVLGRMPTAAMRANVEAAFRDEFATHPSVTRLRVLEDGSIWVRESPHAAGDSVSWVVYDAPDRPRGRLVLGADDRVLGTHEGRVLVALAGDVGVTGELRWARVARDSLATPAGAR